MKPFPRQSAPLARTLLLAAACLPLPARTQTTPPTDRNLVFLDPAHGGSDRGATFNGGVEKDLTLSLAFYLRAALATHGLTVATSRDADLPPSIPLLSTDQRAAAANHLRPAACIVLHATPSGSGINLATSALDPSKTPYDATAPILWDNAQASYVPQSRQLANALGVALVHAKLPVVLTHAALRPLDNLTCPAVTIEVSPLQPSSGRATPIADAAYQRRLAETLAAAILTWRNRAASAAQFGVAP